MASITSPNPADPNSVDIEAIEPATNGSTSDPIDKYQDLFQWSATNQATKIGRALSCNEQGLPSSVSSSQTNRFRHLCTRLKRRFSISKDYRTRSEDMNRGLSVCFSSYKSFSSSSTDETTNDYDWPDFERVYDSIPHCLTRTLPGLDDIFFEDDDNDVRKNDPINFVIDEANEQFDLFETCKRGKHFRRNAICHKLDKAQYHGQLDTFIQQLMIEKLMRTWT